MYPINHPEFLEALRVGAGFEPWIIWHGNHPFLNDLTLSPKPLDSETTTIVTIEEPLASEDDTEQVWPIKPAVYGDGCKDIIIANEMLEEIFTILGVDAGDVSRTFVKYHSDEPRYAAILIDGVLVQVRTHEHSYPFAEISVKTEVFPSTYPGNLVRIGRLISSVLQEYEKFGFAEISWIADPEDTLEYKNDKEE